jgi:hypothetical protein
MTLQIMSDLHADVAPIKPVSIPDGVEGVKLAGYATGHPMHGDRTLMTTPLWWADPSGTWVRSLSRFYGLAGCADDGVFAGREDRP